MSNFNQDLRQDFRSGGARGRASVGVVGTAIVLMMIGVALLLVLPHGREELSGLRQAVVNVFAPIFAALDGIGARINNMEESSRTRLALAEENNALRAENARLRMLEFELSRTRLETERYRKLLSLPLPEPLRFATGRVTADLGSPFARTIVLDIGLSSGVTSGQPVIGLGGLVGRVISVGAATSRVILVTDFNSRIPVFVGDARVRAVLVGKNTPMPQIEFLPKTARPVKGDSVVTSGDGGLIPSGVPVGVVHRAEEREIMVALVDTPDALDYARVILTDAPLPPRADISLPPELQ